MNGSNNAVVFFFNSTWSLGVLLVGKNNTRDWEILLNQLTVANREGTLVLPLCGGKFGDAFAIVRGRVLKDRKKVLKSGWNNESRRGGGINYMNYQANYPGALKESRWSKRLKQATGVRGGKMTNGRNGRNQIHQWSFFSRSALSK